MIKAEVMARVGPSRGLEFGDYFTMSREKRDDICKLVFGTADYVKLGIKFGMLKEDGTQKRKKKKKDKQSSKKKKKNQTLGYIEIIRKGELSTKG